MFELSLAKSNSFISIIPDGRQWNKWMFLLQVSLKATEGLCQLYIILGWRLPYLPSIFLSRLTSTHVNMQSCSEELFVIALPWHYLRWASANESSSSCLRTKARKWTADDVFVASACNVSRILWRKNLLNSFLKLNFVVFNKVSFFLYKPLSSNSSVVACKEWVWREQDEQPRLVTPHTTQ